MPVVDWHQLRKNIESINQGNTKADGASLLAPIYFIFGEDSYLMDVAFKELKESALAGGVADFNLDTYYAADCDINQVKDTIQTFPMMTDHRVVVLKEVQDFSDKEWEELEDLIKNPVLTTVLICLASKLDKRKKFFKTLMDTAVCVEVKRPFDNQLQSWVKYICHQRGLNITEEAVEKIVELVGNNLLEMDSEIFKLSLFLSNKNQIEVDDVTKLVCRSREDSVFELTDAIGDQNRSQALTLLAHLLEQGQNEMGVVSLIARHIRILMQIQHNLRLGIKGPQLSSKIGVPNFYLKKYLDQSQRWQPKRLEQTLLVLAETDKALKSLPVSSHIWLENFILKTCS